MAKDKGSKPAKEAKKAADEKPAKAAAPEFKYGVGDLAKLMSVKEASARVQLRNHGVKKAGKSYGWNSKDELQAVADKLKAPKKEPKAKAEKPAKKGNKE